MAELNSALCSVGSNVTEHSAPNHNNRHLLAALLSSLVPGLGQFFLGEKGRAAFLLAALLGLSLGFWPARLPRTLYGFGMLALLWWVLYVYAVCAALRGGVRGTSIRPSKWWLLFFIPLALVCAHVICGGVIRAAGFRAFTIPSTSMESTILKDERIVVDTHYYREHSPRRGDVLVFHKDDLYVVKRIIAIGGDTIEGRDQEILLNGIVQDEAYVEHTSKSENDANQDTFGPVSVPVGSFFVMGDNRDISLDSRYPGYGLIASKSIVGKALYTIGGFMKPTRTSSNFEP